MLEKKHDVKERILVFFQKACQKHRVLTWMLVLKQRFYDFDFSFLSVGHSGNHVIYDSFPKAAEPCFLT